ncbi:MAG: DUF4062 domain-containing protein [Acidobacteriia bacterium]|nr:DUF4062 domain-containing protein [Terriglobia bacterium]
MPQTAQTLRVVVASPNDVAAERAIVERVASELNRTSAADRNLRLEVARWETDAFPAFHLDGPQGVCDAVLKIESCDVLVGIFWTRFGTVTQDGMTGTEHEITLAINQWRENKKKPQVMIFFNTEAPKLKSSAERRQWALVAEYRERFPAEGLFWEYEGHTQFESEFRKCIQNYLHNKFPLSVGGNAAELSVDRKRTSEGWIRFNIDPKIPPQDLPHLFEAFADFVRQCGGRGIEVTLREPNPHEARDSV